LQKLNNELESRVAERTLQLEMANQELEAFSYSVSHDLRSPLRSISGFAGILQEEAGQALSKEHLGYLQRINVNIQQMEKLINALLNLSRMGRKPLESQLVHPGEIVREVWDELSREIGDRNITLQVDSLPDCQADRVLLKQVYSNLLSNAIKYTRPQPEAVIQAGWTELNGEIIYWVKDNGVGFDMQYAEGLFGIFQRLHNDDRFEGHGVGLSTVKRIILRHQGRIWAESSPNQGATFYFTIGKTTGSS
jgi:light-regulated signal transduction histidine kinase (bacteriophytochrome)